MDVTSYLLGKKTGGGSTPVLQDKEVTITQNGESTVTKDSGYDGLNTVSITTNVPQPSGKITITENGTDIDVSSYATADVSVPSVPTKYAPRYISFGNSTSDYYAYNGTELNNEIANLDTSNITNFGFLFSRCANLVSLDLSNFNTSNVTNFASVFHSCINLSTLNVNNWDTSKVETMSSMFSGCSNLTSLDLSDWHTSALTITTGMFQNCTKLSNIDMRNFDFTNITSYSNMFGSNASSGPANNCLIIVKDATQKQWITSKFSRLTNVKTVAEISE